MQGTTANQQVAKELAKGCRTIGDIEDRLKELFKETLQQALEGELDYHLGYEKHSATGRNSGDSRNGHSKKTVRTRSGQTEIQVPRDRNADFEPQIIRKYQTTDSDLEDRIVSMYAKGLSTRDIEDQMRDIYGVDVSPALVSKVTDRILPQITEWQSRPLDPLYPIVYLDAIYFKVRKDNRIINKAAYTTLGINIEGHKEILGIWIGESESASFWLGVLGELKSRGVKDILIVCKDGLTGFSEAIAAVFPQTEVQLCVIHQIRNSMKYVPYKDRKPLMADLKPVYQALTLDEAELMFEEFKENWAKKYPVVIKSWGNNWTELTAYFRYPQEIRHIVYTTNTVEGYHRQLRKVTKTKTVYPTDDALRKIIYLATLDITRKWTMPVANWGSCLAQLVIYFGDRMTANMVF